jgi:acyl-coenzyme A synthetase/AMP-(fatty) acid ligase
MGSLVQATVVPKAGVQASVLQHELTALCKERLDEYKVPAFWKFSDELPVTSSGKVSRA